MNKTQREETSTLKKLIRIGWLIGLKNYPTFRRDYRKINRINLEYAKQTM